MVSPQKSTKFILRLGGLNSKKSMSIVIDHLITIQQLQHRLNSTQNKNYQSLRLFICLPDISGAQLVVEVEIYHKLNVLAQIFEENAIGGSCL